MKLLSVLIGISVITQLVAKDISINKSEINAFAAQKFKVDFAAQTVKSKQDIVNEFVKNAKLGDKLISTSMKKDVNFKIASRQLAIDIWAQKFMQTVKVNEEDLKKLYKKLSPNIQASYKLRNILVKNEKKANTLIKKLSKISSKSKRLKEFKKLVKKESFDNISSTKEGVIGWVNINKLDPLVQKSLKKSKNKLAKAKVRNIGWQVLLIEDYKKQHKATYKESRTKLLLIAKQNLLKKEVSKILK